MTIGIFTTDRNLIIRSWDSRLLELTGIKAENCRGKSLAELVPDLEERGLLDRFNRVLNEGVIETLAPALHYYLIPCEPIVPSKHFKYMQQRVTLAPLREKEMIVGTIVTLEDVTVRREREQDIAEQLNPEFQSTFEPEMELELNESFRLYSRELPFPNQSSPSYHLISALQENGWQARREMVERLATNYNPQITTELLQLLRQEHRNATIVNSVIQVLALSRVDLIPALIECLHDSDSDLRIYATQTLGQRKDSRAIPALIEALKDPDKNVRYHAIEALGLMKAQAAINPLLEIAQSQDFFLAFPALDALMQMGDATVAVRLMPLIEKTLNWRVRREAVDSLAMQNDPNITQDLLRLLREQHRNPDILNSVLQVLVLSHIDPIPSLIECLKSPDPDLRIYTSLALGERHDPRAIPALIEVLDDPNTNVRYHTIEALGHLQAVEAVEKLVEIALGRDFFLAFPALEALMKIGDCTIAPRLVRLLHDELLVSQVSEVLGHLGDADVVTPMASCLNQAQAPVMSLANAIAKIYRRYQTEFGEGEFIADLARSAIANGGIQNLLNATKTADSDQLVDLVLILGWLEGETVAKALTELLSNPQLREGIIEALVRFGSRITPLLMAQLDAPDSETRKAAVTALGRIGSNRAVPALINLLNADRELVKVTTAALAQIGDGRAFEALIDLLGHPESSVRLGAVAALNSLGHPELPNRICDLLQDPDPIVRESAVKIAGYFAFRECLDLLFQCTRDPEEKVRRAAIEHLPYIDEGPVLPTLVTALTEEESALVRAAAVHALGDLDPVDTLPHLLKALQDQETWVRYQAARSLSRIEMTNILTTQTEQLNQVFEVLQQLVEADAAYPVRAAATAALGHIGREKAIPLLTELIEQQDGDGDVARAAIMALGSIESSDAVAPLLMALNSTQAERRLDALHAFRERGGEEAGLALQWMAAADPEEKVVHAAIESLSRMGTPSAIAALLELSIDPTSREACITALSSRSSESSWVKAEYIEAISLGLNHIHPVVRSTVVEVLKRLKHPLASSIIISALNDQDQGVRVAAVNALVYLGNRGCTEQLTLLARHDPSPAVRRAAQKGLHQ